MNELTTPTSGTLTANQQDAYRLDYEIKAEAQNIVNGICRIGKCLKEMKDRKLYTELGCSSLEEYAEQAVGLKGRAAYNYIMQNIVADFNKAVELVKAFPEEEQESCKSALKKVAEAIKNAGDNL